MKGLVYAILGAFAVLLAFSVYIAERTNDGLVEENYYQKSLEYFRERKIILDISPKPVRAMRELVFTVEFPGGSLAGRPWIELGMAGMAMPPNRVDLTQGEDGRYRGKGVVIRCPSGARTWTATVNAHGRRSALITFDVAD